ncbi:homeobox-leucine zipper protein HAT22-like [Lactuca sativa]|uniref:Homeobox domain-containing protein n=1 Tax=Lactuca sativa TaxID=4236 RepID=A0A9R1USV8_LACSA|nr:homeobox-leucine zipper protein HAT22-like [Lactuca sativa]KAJ0192507.1 hypothetical protein LSAT_V11C800416560 [Lactuca sativa]
MNERERCDTTLGLGIGVGIKRERQTKQNQRSFWLDLSLPLHPKIEASEHVHSYDNEKDDQDSFSSKTIDDQEEEEERGIKRSASNTNVYNNNSDGSRKKLKLTAEQTTLLEDSFKIHCTLNTGQKQELAKKLNLLPRQIEVWFQNRRARTKLKHIEQECSLLKKCCETLNDENRRLKKELQEMRCYSLKFDHHQPPHSQLPLYVRYPITSEMHHPCDKLGKSGQDTKTVFENGGSITQMHGNYKRNAADKLS